jgi:hypothetical protein
MSPQTEPIERHQEYERTPRVDPWRDEIVEELNGLTGRANELLKYPDKGDWNFRFRLCKFFLKELLRLITTGTFNQNQTFLKIKMWLEQYDHFKQLSPRVGWTLIAIWGVLFILFELQFFTFAS